ncbi:MAG: DUF1275 family protein [Alphaproteobacteria bacterium]|nr:DUF1275 family protein [Alphaproteobacteria bacterium]
MIRADARTRRLAVALAALGGYVDAVGFLQLGGFFLSFMSGNTTRLGVALAGGSEDARIAGGLILAFVGGVVLGTLAGQRAGARRLGAVLGTVAGLLILGALGGELGRLTVAMAATAAAMGCVNTAFAEDGEVRIGLTYMTGTLVKLGQHLAAALSGGARFGWTPHLLLWAALLAGAVAGAVAQGRFGLAALWPAAAVAAVIAIGVARRPNS